ncbi:adenosylcobinamide-GDP ribazoletransferase [Thalassococcus sp. BH17M4-6]|uniref:adenosylcobinamide-GDP ribazoletransferase n=1 Tax=Thalassococcus sp. BH17M4-6 TaxID=3413148 RepID=UPI003BCE2CD5
MRQARARWRQEWQVFLLALQFLTRLPVPGDVPFSDDLQTRSAQYYPLVGVVVGLIGGAALWAAAQVWPGAPALLLSLAATLLATGALHEDGLADAADGLGGGTTRDRALEIMRDSRIGSYGVVTIAVVLALKIAVLAAMPPQIAVAALICAHGLSRMAPVHLIATTDYARVDGNKFAAPTVTPQGYRVALLISFVILIAALLMLGAGALVCGLLGMAVLGWGFRALFLRKLGGYTGDCLGGTQQLTELGFYLGVAAAL